MNEEIKKNTTEEDFDYSGCIGCIYEYVDDTTPAIGECMGCSRLSDYGKNDHYRKR